MTAPPGNTFSDLRGIVQLATNSVTGVTGIVESMHRTIQRTPLPLGGKPETRTRGITGLVYGGIRLVSALVGGGIGTALGAAAGTVPARSDSDTRRRAIAILNGVYGDHLEETANPLAMPMHLRWRGSPLDPVRSGQELGTAAGPDLLLFVHGLCLSDLSWQRSGADHGLRLADALAVTPLHLTYNTGRPIAANGRELADLLATLVGHWPVPVRSVSIVGHSMGGLVARSACHHGLEAGHGWTDRVDRLAFLGTPHAGAPLEKAGNLVDRLIELSPYSAPLALVGKSRSAGITDLRHGQVTGRSGVAARLPEQAICYAVAATLAQQEQRVSEAVLGDGLVPLTSALGRSPEAAHGLVISEQNQCVVRGIGHLDLLSEPGVFDQLARWFTD